MQNEPGRGPTRNDKTRERMKQERSSPGATTQGGNETAAPRARSATDPTLSTAGKDLQSSDNSASRRDDAAAAQRTSSPVPPVRTAVDHAQAIDKPMVVSRSREDRIREAAYLRYLARAEHEGDAHADWLAAEAEVEREPKNG